MIAKHIFNVVLLLYFFCTVLFIMPFPRVFRAMDSGLFTHRLLYNSAYARAFAIRAVFFKYRLKSAAHGKPNGHARPIRRM